MIILEDKAQQNGKHELKNRFFKDNHIEVMRVPLPVGDYVVANDKVLDVINRKSARNTEIKKMDFLGTYKVCVDSKFSVQELVSDICGKQHERFRDECILAQNNGIQLIILVENEFEWINQSKGIYNSVIRSLDELFHWKNKRAFIWKNGKQAYPNCTKGSVLAKACKTLEERYGVQFKFCTPQESGAKILELLGISVDGRKKDNQ